MFRYMIPTQKLLAMTLIILLSATACSSPDRFASNDPVTNPNESENTEETGTNPEEGGTSSGASEATEVSIQISGAYTYKTEVSYSYSCDKSISIPPVNTHNGFLIFDDNGMYLRCMYDYIANDVCVEGPVDDDTELDDWTLIDRQCYYGTYIVHETSDTNILAVSTYATLAINLKNETNLLPEYKRFELDTDKLEEVEPFETQLFEYALLTDYFEVPNYSINKDKDSVSDLIEEYSKVIESLGISVDKTNYEIVEL